MKLSNKDQRKLRWANIENDVKARAKKKDPNFCLSGQWKKFVRKEQGLKVYAVDGEWVRNNLSIIFGHGGHGYVHEFIPLGEVWIATHHFPHCGCQTRSAWQKMSPLCFDRTAFHEIEERKNMIKGWTYWRSHIGAYRAEIKSKLFPGDPLSDL